MWIGYNLIAISLTVFVSYQWAVLTAPVATSKTFPESFVTVKEEVAVNRLISHVGYHEAISMKSAAYYY